MDHDRHLGVDGGDPAGGRFHLGRADVGGAVQDLALQVGEIHRVGVGDAEHAHSGRRQVQGRRRSQSAGADDQDLGPPDAQLPCDADLGQQDMPAVPFQKGVIEFPFHAPGHIQDLLVVKTVTLHPGVPGPDAAIETVVAADV